MEEFYMKDGGRAFGSRQCKWKPTQRDLFVATMRRRFATRATLPLDSFGRRYDWANLWNEVRIAKR